MSYFIDFKDRTTNQKYVCQHQTHYVIRAVELATKVAKLFDEEYKENYKKDFDENWSEARKEQFYKHYSWAVRVKDDDGKTVLLLNSDMVRG